MKLSGEMVASSGVTSSDLSPGPVKREGTQDTLVALLINDIRHEASDESSTVITTLKPNVHTVSSTDP